MMMRVLSDPSMAAVSFLQPCLQKQDSTSSAGSLEKCISSPTLVATGKSLYSPGRVSIEQGAEMPHGNENSCAESLANWFQTPPSALCRLSELAANIDNNGVSDDLGLGRHCKDLLELLNQVEDVIVEEAVPDDKMSRDYSGNDCEQNAKTCNSNEQRAACIASESDYSSISYQHFLVLEVSDKHWSDHSSIVKNQPLKVLRLLNESTGEERTLHLSDEWFYSVIGPGDTVSVIGDFDENGKCVVNHNNNLVIVFPDILVSGTRVASSFTCPRRAVLDERLKSREHSTSALIGTMLHQIFQAGLLKDFPATKYLEECATTILQRNTENLYACSANESDTFAQLLEAIPRILNWIKCFRNIEDGRTCVVDFGHNVQKEVSVTEVMDIEEMAWAPKYGLKGIIDASLRIKSVSDSGNSLDTIVPLEIKTGKGTGGQTAMEHCAQVILYTILLSERYLNNGVNSGLLYYLHADETKGIKVQRSDLVGLIMRRNELASDVVRATTTQLLPPMLQNLSVCKGCRHLNACTIYHKAFEGSSESSGLGALFDSAAGHLTSAHIKFLKHWDHLIDLEAKTCQERYLRENHSSCLSSLLLDVTNGFSVDGSQNGRYIYHFLHRKAPQVNQEIGCIDFKQPSKPQDGNLDNSLRCGDYVVISICTPIYKHLTIHQEEEEK
ncbi:DNA replication ATP-dependent helicase Dna2 [Apostasia shenzhenica]|uniref:DNA replication ATP-dependent helicase Dna2 n=1 Tax=Apostasia shenzhenica TaxID=1088818 RepID=A0A2I0ABX6_9ASPA|nr:DNA replication ATP-dependent helicase Dna2 [Apostasia shenzhenica]